jgi:hypothetical protein
VRKGRFNGDSAGSVDLVFGIQKAETAQVKKSHIFLDIRGSKNRFFCSKSSNFLS